MTTQKQAKEFDIEENINDCDISYRGGSLKVDVSDLFPNIENAVMGAYQNYLGGGMAGAVIGAATFDPDELNEKDQKAFYILKERIKKFFYEANQGGGDEYMVEEVNSYQKNQAMPASYPGL